jgi:hypothetical protein
VLGAVLGFSWTGFAGVLFVASGLAQNAGLLVLIALAPAWSIRFNGLNLMSLLVGALFLAGWRQERSDIEKRGPCEGRIRASPSRPVP